MTEPKRTELSVQMERALLVGVILPRSNADPLDPLGELRSLVKTAGAKVVDEMVANRHEINGGAVRRHGQGRRDRRAVRAERRHHDHLRQRPAPQPDSGPGGDHRPKVLDRSELILDIFAAHARRRKAASRSSLRSSNTPTPACIDCGATWSAWPAGASTAAASVGGIGTRGPGEKQLEIDRRLVQKRVAPQERDPRDRPPQAPRGQEPQATFSASAWWATPTPEEHADEPA